METVYTWEQCARATQVGSIYIIVHRHADHLGCAFFGSPPETEQAFDFLQKWYDLDNWVHFIDCYCGMPTAEAHIRSLK